MKILNIVDGIPPRSLGGTARVVWDTAQAQSNLGHAVHIIAPGTHHHSWMAGQVRVHEIATLSQRFAHYRSVFSTRRAREILTIIDEVRPDVIHAHTVAWQCGYRWIHGARDRSLSVIFTCHDVMNIACGRIWPNEKRVWLRDWLRFRWSWNPLRNLLIKRALTRCTVLCVSDALRIVMERKGYTNLQTVHNGIDVKFWHAEDTKEAVRGRLGIPRDALCFFMAGRLGIDKGTELIASTLPVDAHLIVAGEGDTRSFDHINTRFHFFPRQTPQQMRALYTACDVLLQPSLCLDCFPTTCLEASACARPVIASSWGGAKESIEDGITGWIIDPLENAAWAERMQWCMAHRSELSAFGERGRTKMEASFSQEMYVHTLEKIYRNGMT